MKARGREEIEVIKQANERDESCDSSKPKVTPKPHERVIIGEREAATVGIVETMDRLTRLSTDKYDIVMLLGYHRIDDGGGGMFYGMCYLSHPPKEDGGTVVWGAGPCGERDGQTVWRRVYSGPLNVKWFGAVGTGDVHDDDAIEATISALPNGGIVFFPVGTYLIKPFEVTIKGIRLVGASSKACILRYTTVSGKIITLKKRRQSIEHLSIVGPGTSGSETAVFLAGSTFVADPADSGEDVDAPQNIATHKLLDVAIAKVGQDALQIDSYDVVISRCRISTIGNAGINMLGSGGAISIRDTRIQICNRGIMGNAVNVEMNSCNIEQCDYGIYMGGSSAAFHPCVLTNCHFEANRNADMRLGMGGREVTCIACRWGSRTNPPDNNIVVKGSTAGLTLISNRWKGTSGDRITTVKDCLVTLIGFNTNMDLLHIDGGSPNGDVRWIT